MRESLLPVLWRVLEPMAKVPFGHRAHQEVKETCKVFVSLMGLDSLMKFEELDFQAQVSLSY